jgi:hypothetical protein
MIGQPNSKSGEASAGISERQSFAATRPHRPSFHSQFSSLISEILSHSERENFLISHWLVGFYGRFVSEFR